MRVALQDVAPVGRVAELVYANTRGWCWCYCVGLVLYMTDSIVGAYSFSLLGVSPILALRESDPTSSHICLRVATILRTLICLVLKCVGRVSRSREVWWIKHVPHVKHAHQLNPIDVGFARDP